MHSHHGPNGQDGFSYAWLATNRVPGKRTPWPAARSSSLLSKARRLSRRFLHGLEDNRNSLCSHMVAATDG
jgi:hypothetical protein